MHPTLSFPSCWCEASQQLLSRNEFFHLLLKLYVERAIWNFELQPLAIAMQRKETSLCPANLQDSLPQHVIQVKSLAVLYAQGEDPQLHRTTKKPVAIRQCYAVRCPPISIWLRKQIGSESKACYKQMAPQFLLNGVVLFLQSIATIYQQRQNTGFYIDLSHYRYSFVSLSQQEWLCMSFEEHLFYLFPISSSPFSIFIDLLA